MEESSRTKTRNQQQIKIRRVLSKEQQNPVSFKFFEILDVQINLFYPFFKPTLTLAPLQPE